MSPLPQRSSSHRAGFPPGPNSTSGFSGFIRRLSTSSNYTGGVDPTSLIDNQIPNVLLRPASLPTVHQYTLKSSAFVAVKSHARNAQDAPLLYFGEDITGYVIFSLSDSSDIQRVDVVLQVFNSDPINPWLEVKRALSSQQADESQFPGGKICWPFTIAPPIDSISSSSSSAGSTTGSSCGHSTGGELKFELIVTIYRRGPLTRNAGVKQKIYYVPRPETSLLLRSSPLHISASLPGDAPTPAPSLASWPQLKFPTVIVRGIIFGRVDVKVECELIMPSNYPACDSIPLRLVLTSENYEALDLFSVSHVIDVRLEKVMGFGDRAGTVRPLTLRDRGSFHRTEPAARANWVRDGDIRALPPDEHHKRPRWCVKLNGALQKFPGVELRPSYEEPGVTMAIVYFVSFFQFRATEFRPANDPNKVLAIGKIELIGPS